MTILKLRRETVFTMEQYVSSELRAQNYAFFELKKAQQISKREVPPSRDARLRAMKEAVNRWTRSYDKQ